MTKLNPMLQAYRNLGEKVQQAVFEAKAAYEFVPNSFTYSCLSACLAAEQALAVLADSLSALQNREQSA